jgi:hypothetical protein
MRRAWEPLRGKCFKDVGPVCENRFWLTRYNNKLYELFFEPDIVKNHENWKITTGRPHYPNAAQ